MTQFGLFRRQAEAAARNEVSRAESTVRRETSITGEANRLTAAAASRGEKAVRGRWKRRREYTGSVRPRETEAGRKQSISQVTADGYRRKAPVQPIYEEPGYRRRLILRAVWTVLAVVVLLFAIYYLLHSGLLAR